MTKIVILNRLRRFIDLDHYDFQGKAAPGEITFRVLAWI